MAEEGTTPQQGGSTVSKASPAPRGSGAPASPGGGSRGGPGGGRGGPGGGRGGYGGGGGRGGYGGGRGGPGGGRGGPGGGRGGRGGRGGGRQGSRDDDENRLEERVVKINKCSTVVKGGRRFSFSALVVVGDRQGSVGVGFGKAKEVPPAVDKGIMNARKNMGKVAMRGSTIPHRVDGRFLSTKVVMVPASEGTGVIAGAAVRAVVECAGIKDLLTKVYGSANPMNVVKATLEGLKVLRSREEVARLRNVEV